MVSPLAERAARIKAAEALKSVAITGAEFNFETPLTLALFPVIEISGSPCSNDVLGLHDLYVQIDLENTLINAISDSDNMDSAASSYANGSLVRGQKVIPGSTTCDTPDDTVFTANGATVASTTASSASTTASTPTSTTSSSGGGSASSGGGGSSYSY